MMDVFLLGVVLVISGVTVVALTNREAVSVGGVMLVAVGAILAAGGAIIVGLSS